MFRLLLTHQDPHLFQNQVSPRMIHVFSKRAVLTLIELNQRNPGLITLHTKLSVYISRLFIAVVYKRRGGGYNGMCEPELINSTRDFSIRRTRTLVRDYDSCSQRVGDNSMKKYPYPYTDQFKNLEKPIVLPKPKEMPHFKVKKTVENPSDWY